MDHIQRSRLTLKGRAGEDYWEEVLKARGHKILARNFKCTHAEVDIISRSPEACIIVWEVKHWSNADPLRLEKAFNAEKINRLRSCARRFLSLHPQPDVTEFRIDACIINAKDGAFTVHEGIGS